MALKKRRVSKHATKGKKQAWKKGQSSSYNPKCIKFREEAKKRGSFERRANPNLTETAIARHNNAASVEMEEDLDCMSEGNTSFVSSFSTCTNPAFNRLLKRWQSNSALHKEMLAVLAAVTEVIKEKGGKESETEYFAALVTTLDVVENDEARTAVLSLLYMVVKRLPVTVLKINFSKFCPVLKELLIKYMDTDFNALLRNLLGCLLHFLKVQNTTSWTESVKDVYSVLLEFSVHPKPKVRKFAQDSVISLLKSFDSGELKVLTHPAASATAEFCVKKLEIAGSLQSNTTFHILNLLQHVMGYFPRTGLKLSCETILRVMTLSDALVYRNSLKAFHGLFEGRPEPESLPDQLNVKIIKALYDYSPSISDSEPMADWLLVMESAFVNLYRLNPSLCVSHLPHFFKTAVSYWLSEKDEIYPLVSSTLKNLLYSCVVPSSDEFQQFMQEDPVENPMHRMFHNVEVALSYQYFRAWKQVLVAVTAFFDVMGKHSYPEMIKCLQSLADLRDSFKFPHIAELEKAVGAAVRRMGPEVVLKAVPLQISGKSDNLDFPRSWLLPILRDNIQETKMEFFAEHFLPLIQKLRNKIVEFEKEKKVVESKTYDVICSQIWSLLPAFCTLPTDVKKGFETLASELGAVLREQPTLRMTILSALRVLVWKNLDNDENKAEIGRFSKNYMPILFNLYTTESKDKAEERVRLAVFDTAKMYLQVTDRKLVRDYFIKAMEKLRDAVPFTQQALLDLTKALLPYIDEDQISQLYEYCKPLLQDINHTVQKKAYGVLSELCSNQTEASLSFVTSHIDDLKSVLLTSLSNSVSPSKAMRLNCLRHIICYLSNENKDFILAVVPEATLCTKEASVKARTAAYNLLSEIGHTLNKWRPEDSRGVLRDYLHMLLAGLAGSPHMMSATILAISHVIHEFKGSLDSDVIHLLIENMCLLLTSRSREVVMSALSFIKVLFTSVNTMDLAQHVEHLVSGIANISGDNQRHFRFKAKELLTRLIRKFGFEMISKLAPQQFQKQLMNIRKTEARKLKKKVTPTETLHPDIPQAKQKTDLIDDILNDSEEEIEEAMPLAKEKSRESSKRNDSAWIAESADKDIVDFMDPTVNRKIFATKPTAATKVVKKRSTSFEMTKDGRLIIPANEKPSINITSRKKRPAEEAGDEGTSVSKNKKRKVDDLSGDEDADGEAKSKVVLKGIHRTFDKSKKLPGSEYRAKKAGGDMKKGKLDPYAYIPLNRQLLNKRKQRKREGQFKGIVRAAKRGALKGSKRKSRSARRK